VNFGRGSITTRDGRRLRSNSVKCRKDYAANAARFREVRKPTKPASIIAEVDSSGTLLLTAVTKCCVVAKAGAGAIVRANALPIIRAG
jgi:hypothetical protein